MLLELHLHTNKYSACSHLDPVEAVHQVVKKGLQGLVLTEHHYQWSQQQLDELLQQAAVSRDFVLLSGQEVDTDFGHVLVFGAGHTIGERTPLEQLRRDFPQAALVWAHPFRHNKTPKQDKLESPLLDAVEIFNSNHTARGNYLALSSWHRHKFVATAGSDAHARDTAGLFPTLLDHPVVSMAQLVAEIKAGRCRPLLKEIPKAGSHTTVTEITIGTKGEDEARQRIIVKKFASKKKWNSQQQSVATTQHLLDNGFRDGPLRVPSVLEVNPNDRLIIEQGQRGKSLHELLLHVSPEVAQVYLQQAARWLAAMHALPPATQMVHSDRETQKLMNYLARFQQTGSPYVDQATRLVHRILSSLAKIEQQYADSLVLCHGDYHPKNVIVGQDKMQDVSTTYVSVIDFERTKLAVPAYDVGAFLAQYRHQLSKQSQLHHSWAQDFFYRPYCDYQPNLAEDFQQQVWFFQLRANLSIAAFLIKLGLGESQDMAELMERCGQLEIQLGEGQLGEEQPGGANCSWW